MQHTHDASALPSQTAFGAAEFLDVAIEPRALFTRPYDPARWKRFLAATALGVIAGGLLMAPVRLHVAALAGAAPNLPFTLVSMPLSLLLLAALGIAVSFVLAFVLQAPLRARVPARVVWMLVSEIAVVKLGLSTALLGLIVTLRGNQAFFSSHDVARAMPSLAMLVPSAPARLSAVLGVVDPFNLWVCVLFYFVFRDVFRARAPYAAFAGFAIGLLPQLLVRAIAP